MPAAKTTNGATITPAATPEPSAELAVADQATELTELTEVPADLIADSGMGTENILPEDIVMPRLALCQAGSPLRQGKPKGIQGLNELDMFNNQPPYKNYGPGPLKIVVMGYIGFHHMIFAPFEQGGGVLEYRVAPDDKRTEFTPDPNGGKSKKPIATKFMNYLVWLPEHGELMAISFKSSQLKVATQLSSKLKEPLKLAPNLPIVAKPPAWARTFTISTFMDSDKVNSWGNYKITPAGITPPDTRALCSQIARDFVGKTINVDTSDEVSDATQPSAAIHTMDAEYTSETVPASDKIPF